jgi:hypothetical protein
MIFPCICPRVTIVALHSCVKESWRERDIDRERCCYVCSWRLLRCAQFPIVFNKYHGSNNQNSRDANSYIFRKYAHSCQKVARYIAHGSFSRDWQEFDCRHPLLARSSLDCCIWRRLLPKVSKYRIANRKPCKTPPRSDPSPCICTCVLHLLFRSGRLPAKVHRPSGT